MLYFPEIDLSRMSYSQRSGTVYIGIPTTVTTTIDVNYIYCLIYCPSQTVLGLSGGCAASLRENSGRSSGLARTGITGKVNVGRSGARLPEGGAIDRIPTSKPEERGTRPGLNAALARSAGALIIP